jgi:hypothetical protein
VRLKEGGTSRTEQSALTTGVGLPVHSTCRVAKDSTEPGIRFGRGRRESITTKVKVACVSSDNETSRSYTVHRAGGLRPKKRVVKRHGRLAALMEGGTWEGTWNSYLFTFNPGINLVSFCHL